MERIPPSRVLYERLNAHFGDLGWWPGDTPFEVAVGAILTQNTAWKNVENAIRNLKTAGILTPEGIHGTAEPTLAEMIRPAGYFRVKARRLKAFLRYLGDRHGLSMSRMFVMDTERLRDELLSVHGIGEETADCILLYGGGRPVFVVDVYTRRILARHGWINGRESYAEIRDFAVRGLPESVPLYRQFHALFVQTGKVFCRKPSPRCGGCPAEGLGRECPVRKGEPCHA